MAEKLFSFLNLWNNKTSNVEIRLQFIKTVQYIVKLLLNYYNPSSLSSSSSLRSNSPSSSSTTSSSSFTSTLLATNSACEIATRAFRLFKSVNSANKIIQLLSSDNNKEADQPIVLFFKGVEEALSVIHYYHENKLFLSSLGIIKCDQKYEENRIKLMWFLSQVAQLAALIMEYRYHLLTIQSLKWRISRLESTKQNTEQKKESHYQVSSSPPPPTTFSLEILQEQLIKKEALNPYYTIQLVKCSMNVLVSGSNARIFGDYFQFPDSISNFFGLTATTITIVEGFLENTPNNQEK